MSNRKAGKAGSKRRYGAKAAASVASAMHEMKRGQLKRGRGGKAGVVRNPRQAVAIGLSEARRKGAKVPKKKQ